MHASFLRASVVVAEACVLRCRQVIEYLLLEPVFVSSVLLLVLLQYALEGLETTPLGQPALAMCFEVLFAVVDDLLLRLDRAIEALQEVFVILPLCRADAGP